jgi:hypothetical protein
MHKQELFFTILKLLMNPDQFTITEFDRMKKLLIDGGYYK